MCLVLVQLFCNFLISEATGDNPKTLDFIELLQSQEELFDSYGPDGQGLESLRVRHREAPESLRFRGFAFSSVQTGGRTKSWTKLLGPDFVCILAGSSRQVRF